MEKEAYSLSQERTTASSASPVKWDYTCLYCDRTFDSGRALGGHQNAHRFEPREKRRTHHKRVPKKDRCPPNESLWPPPNHSLWAPNPKTNSHHHQGYPVKMQDGVAEGSRNGPYLNAMSADGVAELDLELKL